MARLARNPEQVILQIIFARIDSCHINFRKQFTKEAKSGRCFDGYARLAMNFEAVDIARIPGRNFSGDRKPQGEVLQAANDAVLQREGLQAANNAVWQILEMHTQRDCRSVGQIRTSRNFVGRRSLVYAVGK